MSNRLNIFGTSMILRTDVYKFSHWRQYPQNMTNLYSYFEARNTQYDEIVSNITLNYILKQYFNQPITMEDIDYAEDRINNSYVWKGIFNRTGWERVLNKHGGYLPIRIKAVPEGLVLKPRNVLLTVESTDDELPWVTNHSETILSQLWYGMSVSTLGRKMKKLILKHLEDTGDPESIDYRLVDFGFRGVETNESAACGGFGHLVNFKASDTVLAGELAYHFYNERNSMSSIPASEHSTITCWGEQNESMAYENMINQYGDMPMFACVIDSYDPYNAVGSLFGEQLHNKVMNMNATLLCRPDSGIPHVVVSKIANILENKFGVSINEKGYKVLNKVRIIQGDGVNYDEIERILIALKNDGFSSTNISFGCGGVLLQKMDRDSVGGFAFKASSGIFDGGMRDIYKRPITDSFKNSKKGRLKLIKNEFDEYETVSKDTIGHDILQTTWENGELKVDPTLKEIRDRSKL